MIQEFKDYQRVFQSTEEGRHSAFATYQGNNNPNSATNTANQGSNSGNQPKYPCVCGKNHWFSNCFYLIPSIRPKGWKPSAKIEKEIKEKLKSDPRLKEQVEKTKSRSKNRTQDQSSKAKEQD